MHGMGEPSEQELEKYLFGLKPTEKCQYMTGSVVDLCTIGTECKFKGKETFSLRHGSMPECRRVRVMELKRLLGR